MGTTWAPSAHWMVVIDGIPRYHSTRAAAVHAARTAGVPAYRQGVFHDPRISIVYDPATDTEYKAHDRIVWPKEKEPERCQRCGSPTSIRKPGSCINADCPLWEGPFA